MKRVMLYFKRIFIIGFIFSILIFIGKVFSYESNTLYTNFYFCDQNQTNLGTTNSITISTNKTGEINYCIENLFSANSIIDITIKDAVDIGNNLYGCTQSNENFKNYIEGEKSITIDQTGLYTGSFGYNFSSAQTGSYTGCIVYTTSGNKIDGPDAISQKAIIFSILNTDNIIPPTPTETGFNVKMIANIYGRNGIKNGEHTANLYGFESSGFMYVYKCENGFEIPFKTGYISMNRSGIGSSDIYLETGCYNIMYKGWSHLAIYMSGLYFTGQTINFVSGENISGLYPLIIELSNTETTQLSYNGGTGFILPGDLTAEENGKQDGQITLRDYSILTTSCHWGPQTNEKFCDLNNDGSVGTNDTAFVLGRLYQRGITSFYDCTFTDSNQKCKGWSDGLQYRSTN